MSENHPADDDASVFHVFKDAGESTAKMFHLEDDDASVIGTLVGALASMFRAVSRS